MENSWALIFIVAIVIIVVVMQNKKLNKLDKQKKVDMFNNYYADAQNYCDKVYEQNSIPEISIPIQLKRDEKGYLEDQVTFFEQRSKTVSNRGGGAIRVAKGIYIGGSQGVSRSVPEMREIDRGMMYFTNKRILFLGQNAIKEYPLKKIISIEIASNGFWIASEGLQKRQFYQTSSNPLLWTVVLSIQNQIDNGGKIPHIVLDRG